MMNLADKNLDLVWIGMSRKIVNMLEYASTLPPKRNHSQYKEIWKNDSDLLDFLWKGNFTGEIQKNIRKSQK